MLLEIEKQADIAVAPEAAWMLLRDMPRLAQCVPHVNDLVEVTPEQQYTAMIADKLGPFRITVPVKIDIQTIEPPRRIVAGISGQDAKGQARLKGTLEAAIDDAANGTSTHLVVRMRVDVLGKLATLGAAPMRRRADQIFAEFIANISQRLTEAPTG